MKAKNILYKIKIDKKQLENISFKFRLCRRKVKIRNCHFSVYAWHPKPWLMNDSPPISWILDNVLPNHVIYDIGANRGYFTLAILSHTPNAKIFAFEPNPEIITKLMANLDLNKARGQVRVIKYALGAEKGVSQFNIACSDSASSIIFTHAKNRGNGVKSVMEIQVESIDNLVSKKRLPGPNHIKIDTEGFEADILDGAKNTIKKYRPYVYAEIHVEDGLKTNEQQIRQILSSYRYLIMKYGMQLLCVPRNNKI